MAEMPVSLLRQYLTATPSERRTILDAHVASFRERASAVESVVDELRRTVDLADIDGGVRFCSVSPPQFAGALAQVSFAIADPAVRVELGAVWVETKEDSFRVVATDSYRLAVRDLVPERTWGDGLRGVIDALHVKELVAELPAASTLVLSQDAEGVITAAVDGSSVTVGHRGEGFPDYERILTALPQGHQIVLPRDALTRAIATLPVGAPHIRLDFEPEQLVLGALESLATVPGIWTGPRLHVHVDARFFAEAIHATVGPDVVVEAVDPFEPITLRSADTGTFSVLTMPIRPPEAG